MILSLNSLSVKSSRHPLSHSINLSARNKFSNVLIKFLAHRCSKSHNYFQISLLDTCCKGGNSDFIIPNGTLSETKIV